MRKGVKVSFCMQQKLVTFDENQNITEVVSRRDILSAVKKHQEFEQKTALQKVIAAKIVIAPDRGLN